MWAMRHKKEKKETEMMLLPVVCNNQHLARIPMCVFTLNEKMKANEANILFKITTFLNQSTYLLAFAILYFLLQS